MNVMTYHDLPNFQFLASYMSFESEGTVGLKNGLRIMYAFESRTSGKTRRVPWVGPVSLEGTNMSAKFANATIK